MGKDSMSSERMGLFWTFLDTGKFDKALKCIASADFQYNAMDSNITMLVRAIATGLGTSRAEQKQSLELMKALTVGGASWTQASKSSNSTQSLSIWKEADASSKISVRYGNHSAISFAQQWLRQLHEKKGWESEVSYLHQGVEIFLAEAQPSRTKVAIDEDIVSKLRKS